MSSWGPVFLVSRRAPSSRLTWVAKSSRSSRLRGESWAGLSPRRREAREENAKAFSLVAALLLCVHRWLRFFQCAAESAEYFCDHAPADIGQLFVSAGMQESEPVLIQTEEMQQRGVYVAHRDLFCGRSHGKLIRFAECRSRFHVASRHPDDEPILVVIATGLARRQIVVEWRAAHLG